EADKFYPSSKLCHKCGHKKVDLKLSDRTYHCDKCGYIADRDYNTSLNLASYSA
ncbi:MAG TPA: transposase, partial [Enterococcus columbae]|nr:transposase [Enterococcus columbae]